MRDPGISFDGVRVSGAGVWEEEEEEKQEGSTVELENELKNELENGWEIEDS